MAAGAMPRAAFALVLASIMACSAGAAPWQMEGVAGAAEHPQAGTFGERDGGLAGAAGTLDTSVRTLLYSASSPQERTSGTALDEAIRNLVNAPSRRRLMKSKPDCKNYQGFYGSPCTGSPGFWTNSNGFCLWPAQTITIGTRTYSRDPQCWDIMDQGTAYPITKLCYQLIPAILGRLNFALSGNSVPSNIDACINQGNAMIGDRVINPVGDGLCPCCATSSCNAAGSTSVCRDPPSGTAPSISFQGCVPLADTSYTPVNSVVACVTNWNVAGECPVGSAA
ncbi:hypothetical protein ABPG75_010309 [Micractinium tetrahymenae]